MGFVALLLCSACVALGSVSLARHLASVQRRVELVVVAVVLGHVLIIGTGYALALLDLLRATSWGFGAVAASLLAVGVSIVLDGGVGVWWERTVDTWLGLGRLLPDLAGALRGSGWVCQLAVSVAVALVVWLAFAVSFSPSRGNSDALFYHEAIVGFLIQNEGLAVVDLPSSLQRINGMPRFTHMLQCWFAIFTGRTFVEMPNVLAHVLGVASIYTLSRALGLDRARAAGWAFCFSLSPGVLRLTDTVMVDVHGAGLVLAACACTIAMAWTRRAALTAAAAVALIVGTKYHLVPLAGALCLVIAGRTFAARKRWGQMQALAVLSAAAAVVLVAVAAVNLRNYLLFDNPIFPAGLKVDALGINWRAPTTLRNSWASGKGLGSSKVFYYFSAAPFSVKPWTNAGARVEDYGVGVVVLAFPLAVLALVAGWVKSLAAVVRGRHVPARLWPLLMVSVVFFVGLYTFPALVRGRYYLALLGLSLAVVGWWWSGPRHRALHRQFLSAAQALMILSVVWSFQHGWVIKPSDVWRRVQVDAELRDFTNRALITLSYDVGMLRIREQGAGKKVGFDDGVYIGALWNDDYSNEVHWVGRRDPLGRADALGVDWLYYQRRALPSGPRKDQWEVISKQVMTGRRDVRTGWLYRRRPAAPPALKAEEG